MLLRIWKLVSVSLLALSAFGCEQNAVRSSAGRLDLVVRPEGTAASSASPQGSFTVRSLDSASTVQTAISLDDAHETRSTVLPAGLYTIAWQPEGSFEDPVAATSVESPRLLAIGAGQVTTLTVRVSSALGVDTRTAALVASR